MTSVRISIPIPSDSNEELSKCLEPCPFCGSRNLEILQDKDNYDGHTLYFIRHWDEGCVLYGRTMRYTSREELIRDWNRRYER